MALWSAGNIRSSGCGRSPMLINSGASTRLTQDEGRIERLLERPLWPHATLEPRVDSSARNVYSATRRVKASRYCSIRTRHLRVTFTGAALYEHVFPRSETRATRTRAPGRLAGCAFRYSASTARMARSAGPRRTPRPSACGSPRPRSPAKHKPTARFSQCAERVPDGFDSCLRWRLRRPQGA